MGNLRGILLVTMAMALFTVEDSFIKFLSGSIPVGQILFITGAGGMLLFGLAAVIMRKRLLAPVAWSRLYLLRMLAEAAAGVAFYIGLWLVDLSVVAAVFQATPLAVTLGAALFLREHVGWRRWIAIMVGFCGVLLIIRPGLAGFDPATLFVVVAVLCVAARDLMTRRMDLAVDSLVLSFQGSLAVLLAAPLLMLAINTPPVAMTGTEINMMLIALIFGAVGYYGIVASMRVGETAVVTPFRYTRLLFAIVAGVLVFGERPDMLTLTGAALIMATGLFTILRERRLARARGLM